MENKIKTIRSYLASFLDIRDPIERAVRARFLFSQFEELLNCLQDKRDFSPGQVSERSDGDPLMHDLAEGYWRIGVSYDRNFINLAEKLYSW